MSRLSFVLAALCACATSPPHAPFTPGRAEPIQKEKLLALASRLDEHFQKQFDAAGATGLAVGIILQGELVYARGFGVQDVQTKTPVGVDSVFRIASMTKSFTAAAILGLCDHGKLSLDAPAATYLPELAAAPPTRDSAPITIRHLLTNASGLAYDDSWGVVSFGTTEAELTRILGAGLTFGHAPGERYGYSNLGYALLGRIVERVSHTRFRDHVTTHLLRPLGMSSTVWESTDVPPARLAVGYRRNTAPPLPEPRPPSAAFDAAGGLYSSLRDYARYAAFHLAAHPARDDPESGPLRRSSLREMHAGQRWARWRGDHVPLARRTAAGDLALEVASYGHGWLELTTCDHEGIVQHFGGEPGYWSTVHLLPRRDLGVVTFSTTAAVGSRAFAGALARLRDGGALPPLHAPPPHPALVETTAAVDRLLERWDPALADRTFDPASRRFPWMSNLEAELARLSHDHGPCRRAGPLTTRSRTQATWRLECERGAIDFSAALTPSVPPRLQILEWTTQPPNALCAP